MSLTKPLVQSKQKNQVYYYNSPKHPRLLYCESYFEMQMVRALDFNPNVKRFVTQPFTIAISKTWRYTPDAIVQYKDKTPTTVFEFKPLVKLRTNIAGSGKLKGKLALYKERITMKKGFAFAVLSEDAYSPIEFKNHDFLYPSFKNTLEYVESWYQLNRPDNFIRTFGDINARFESLLDRTLVKSCIAYGLAKIDLKKLITCKTPIVWRRQ
ncbi:TnsA endonuclease N-terminal domain-containing protein [Paraglaciecola sp. L1A13]|uniref:TnsA endonuclease N-terminal domain-containing protein n=1 Tax=Paraglaciecola sp. L1A13 TaxID=2686359 RepID=UPI00131E7A92|nr:TnsA endonuclease N-terminal domain-containing protein [Paraglaciecola sp. L1A13]